MILLLSQVFFFFLKKKKNRNNFEISIPFKILTKLGCTSYGNNLPRICTWGRFLDKTSSTTFYFYNTHLDHQSVTSREKSAVQLV